MSSKLSEKKDKRKELIRNTAYELFSSRGYMGTSMNDIVRASGVSKGGIYVYYRSKEDIFQEIADEVIINRRSIVNDFHKDITFSEQLKSYIEGIISNYNKTKYKKRIRFTFEFWIENKDRKSLGGMTRKEYLDKRYKSALEDIDSILQGGINSGEFRTDVDRDTFIYLLFAAVDGLAFYSGILDKPNPENVTPVMADLFESFIALRPIQQAQGPQAL